MLLLHGAAGAKKLRFLKYHLGAVVLFALLYKAQDEFMSRFPEQGKSLGLGHTHPLNYWNAASHAPFIRPRVILTCFWHQQC